MALGVQLYDFSMFSVALTRDYIICHLAVYLRVDSELVVTNSK